MAKLAFTSLFFFTVLSMITAAPITELQSRTTSGVTPHYLENDGLSRQVDNRMDRGRSVAMDYDYDLQAGNPLESEIGQDSIRPVEDTDDEDDDGNDGNDNKLASNCVEGVVVKLCLICDVTGDVARDMIETSYKNLSALEKYNIVYGKDGLWQEACRQLEILYESPTK